MNVYRACFAIFFIHFCAVSLALQYSKDYSRGTEVLLKCMGKFERQGTNYVYTPFNSSNSDFACISNLIEMCFLLTTSSLAWTLMIVCTSIYIYMYNCAFGSLISDVTCNYVSADGGRAGLWWHALLGHWSSIPDVDNVCLLCIGLYLGCCFYFNHITRMFLPTDFAFRIMDWTSCHGPHIFMLY